MSKINLKQIKTIFDRAVKAERFSERSLFDRTEGLRAWSPVARLNIELEKLISAAELQVVHRRMTRAIHFIELVKSDVTSTKYDVRWTARLANDDPRKASFDECCAIHETLCRELLVLLGDSDFRAELKLVVPVGLVSP